MTGPSTNAAQAAGDSADRWRGVLPSIPTPFTNEETVDHDALSAVVDFVIRSGASGVVCLGVAGEVEMVTSPEREEIVRTVVKAADDRVPVLAGATAESLRSSESLAGALEAAGASGIVLPPPGNMRLDAGELVGYFSAMAASTELPVIVQDAPQYLGTALSPEVVTRAAGRSPNIRGVKLEHGPEEIERWRAELSADLAIFSGNGGLHMIDCLEAGSIGVMPAADLTDLLVEIYRYWVGDEQDKARDRYAQIAPMLVYEMQSMPHGNRCAKYVLARRGVPLRPALRAPATPGLSPSSVARLDRHLETVLPHLPARGTDICEPTG